MLVGYIRSSSYNCYSFCPFQFWLTYTLGLKPTPENGWTTPKPQKKADKGNIVHKALELLARKKVAVQDGQESFREDEVGKEWRVAGFGPETALSEAWDYYTLRRCPDWDWGARDHRDCRKWVFDTLEMQGGAYHPENRKVVMPEQYFDIEIARPWARYSFPLPSGGRAEGTLAIKGTVDLITEIDTNTIELVDWKTGMRKDWSTGQPKTWKKLRDDPQLRIYHYALAKLYPQYKHVVITIVYIQDGGPFSLPFEESDLAKTEAMLRERFETIRDCERPSRIIRDREQSWKCSRLCVYGQNRWQNTGETVCDHLHSELLTLGMDRATAKHAVPGAFASYGEGGGRSAK